MISAAASAGFTSTLGTPFGGVMFQIETTSNFFMVDNLWKSFYCSTIATLTYSVFHLAANLGTYVNTEFTKVNINHEVVLYAILGYICGLQGEFMNYILGKLVIFRT